ncbi:MAG: hypothetical protein P8020_14730 [Acidobacteriota bacterium]|jgi:hypothetical protein
MNWKKLTAIVRNEQLQSVEEKLQEIVGVIASKGHQQKLGLFGRMRRAFIHYTEQNEFDNATAPDPPCCSNPRSHPSCAGYDASEGH